MANRARAARLAWRERGLRVGTINVAGLTQLKTALLTDLMRRLCLDIMGVTETWEGRCQPDHVPGYTFVGRPRRGGQGGGVGFYISQALAPLTTLHTSPSLPEALWLEVAGARPAFVGLVYLPPASVASAQAADATMAALQTDIAAFQSRGRVVVMGDFNSRIGRAAAPAAHVGAWGVDEQPDAAGSALTRLMQATDLYALNGRTPSPSPAHHAPEYTRRCLKRRADGAIAEECAVLDYVLAPREWALGGWDAPACRLMVESSRRVDGADHLLLHTLLPHACALRRAPARCAGPSRPRVEKLTTPTADRKAHEDAYQEAIKQRLGAYEDSVADLLSQVESGALTPLQAVSRAKSQLVEGVLAAAADSIGVRPPPRACGSRKPPVWTPEVQQAVGQRKTAAADLAQAQARGAPAQVSAASERLYASQRAVRAAVKEARYAHVDQLVSAAGVAAEENQGKRLWQLLGRIAGKRRAAGGPAALRAPGSEGLVVGEQQIADVLAGQYQRTTDPAAFAAGAGFDDEHKVSVEADVADMRAARSYCEEGPAGLSDLFDAGEVARAIGSIHNGKAPSPLDGVNGELLKFGGACLVGALVALFNAQLVLETKAQTTGVITPLFKKGEPTDPANWRPITLGSSLDKAYNSCINARLVCLLEGEWEGAEGEPRLHDAQQGFRPGRSCLDCLHMLTTVLHARLSSRQLTYLLFVDVEKAYDSVWRAGLLWHLWDKGVRGRLFRVIANMADAPRSMVRHRGCLSGEFAPGMGWEQGDTLATTLFNVFIDSVLAGVWREHPGVPIPAGDAAPHKLVALMYADDLAATCATPEGLQAAIDTIAAGLRRWRLKASVRPGDGSKTAVLVVGRGAPAAAARQHAWSWAGVPVPVVDSYKYLGVLLHQGGGLAQHFAHRMQKADAAARAQAAVLKQSGLPWAVRRDCLVAAVQPVLTYAAQIWSTPTQAHRRMLDSWQAKHLTAALHCPANANRAPLLQEVGLLPLSIACEKLALAYWHHLSFQVPADRLLAQVAAAWPAARRNPWLKYARALVRDYEIDEAAAADMGRAAFQDYLQERATARALRLWADEQGRGARDYTAAYGAAAINRGKPTARAFVHHLSSRRGRAGELLVQLRAGCAPLRAAQPHRREGESGAARAAREVCPCCEAGAETPTHFLLQCPAYAPCRSELMMKLQRVLPAPLWQRLRRAEPEQQAALLLGDVLSELDSVCVPGHGFVNGCTAMADYVCTAANTRNSALAGRGPNVLARNG
jgi:hypothetical protein